MHISSFLRDLPHSLLSQALRFWSVIVMLAVALLSGAGTAHAQTLTVLHSFTVAEGQSLQTALVRDAAGNLYGTAYYGGSFQRCDNEVGGGTVFKVEPSGKTSILHVFNNGTDGCFPGDLVLDDEGNVFGNSIDNIYEINAAGGFSTLHLFLGLGQGIQPHGPLTRDAEGNFYGTAESGGRFVCGLGNGCGTVFKMDPLGNVTVLYDFTGKADGGVPTAGVILDAAGNLYGTTTFGGRRTGTCSLPHFTEHGCGTVFKLSPDGVLTVLYSFTGGTDGQNPTSGLMFGADGNLYGVTTGGGNLSCNPQIGCGTVYRVTTAGLKTTFHAFQNPEEGSYPSGTLVQDSAGTFYGTASSGGTTDQAGLIYKLDSNGNETVLHRFNGKDGDTPLGGVILDSAGNLYGTTAFGGSDGSGNVFKFVP